MSHRLLDEDFFALKDGPAKLGKSRAALYGYIKRGRRSLRGKVVFLESCILESGVATSVEAFARFRRRLNDDE